MSTKQKNKKAQKKKSLSDNLLITDKIEEKNITKETSKLVKEIVEARWLKMLCEDGKRSGSSEKTLSKMLVDGMSKLIANRKDWGKTENNDGQKKLNDRSKLDEALDRILLKEPVSDFFKKIDNTEGTCNTDECISVSIDCKPDNSDAELLSNCIKRDKIKPEELDDILKLIKIDYDKLSDVMVDITNKNKKQAKKKLSVKKTKASKSKQKTVKK